MPDWTITEPRELTLDRPVDHLTVQIVAGTVNVVGSNDPTPRLEVTELRGAPLTVAHHGARMVVSYPDLSWKKGLFSRLGPRQRHRHAVVSVAVPVHTTVDIGVVSAEVVVSGIAGRTRVHGVSGDTTLVGVAGEVTASTVSGSVAAQAVSGNLQVSSVSGELTVVEGAGSRVRADSVSGDMVLDLVPFTATDVTLHTVSGEVAIRLPHPAHARVDANTASGTVSTTFDELRLDGKWGGRRLTGTLGNGRGKLRVNTVSGAVALLRRPSTDDEPARAERKVL